MIAAEKKKKIFKGIGIVIVVLLYVFLLLISIVAIVADVYITKNSLGIENIDITYTSKMYEEDGTERYPLEVVYYKNEDGRGVEAFEFCINSFSDYNFQALKGQGCQFINEEKMEGGLENIEEWSRYDYTRQSGLAWASMSEQELESGANGSQFYFNIDDQAYQFRLEGISGVSYVTNAGATASKVIDNFVNPITALKNIGSLFTGGNIFSNDKWVSYDTVKHYFTLDDFYYEIANSLTVSNVSSGEYSMSLVEMTRFFNIYKISDNGTVSESNSNADFADLYFDVNVKVMSSGLVRSEDSSFGIVGEDSDWTLVEEAKEFEDFVSYEQSTIIFADSFDFYDYPALNAVAISLKESVKESLTDANYNYTHVLIDFTSDYLSEFSDKNLLLLDDFMINVPFNGLYIKFNDASLKLYTYLNESELQHISFVNVSGVEVVHIRGMEYEE